MIFEGLNVVLVGYLVDLGIKDHCGSADHVAVLKEIHETQHCFHNTNVKVFDRYFVLTFLLQIVRGIWFNLKQYSNGEQYTFQ